MKRTLIFMRCLESKIKKKFFKMGKDDKSQSCEELKKMNAEWLSIDDKKRAEEYTDMYRLTTRWQTL